MTWEYRMCEVEGMIKQTGGSGGSEFPTVIISPTTNRGPGEISPFYCTVTNRSNTPAFSRSFQGRFNEKTVIDWLPYGDYTFNFSWTDYADGNRNYERTEYLYLSNTLTFQVIGVE